MAPLVAKQRGWAIGQHLRNVASIQIYHQLMVGPPIQYVKLKNIPGRSGLFLGDSRPKINLVTKVMWFAIQQSCPFWLTEKRTHTEVLPEGLDLKKVPSWNVLCSVTRHQYHSMTWTDFKNPWWLIVILIMAYYNLGRNWVVESPIYIKTE